MSFITNPNNLYYTTDNNLLVLNETDERLKNIINNNSLLHRIFNFISEHFIVLIICFIIILLSILYYYNKYHKEDFNNINNNNNNIPSTFYSDTQDAEEDMANNYNRPTFNPLHPLDNNQNYNHFTGNDPLFNGVYNNNVHDRHYKPMDGLLDNSMILDDYPYADINNNIFNHKPIINTNPSYFNANSLLPISDNNYKDYRKINEENINGKITMTFKPVK